MCQAERLFVPSSSKTAARYNRVTSQVEVELLFCFFKSNDFYTLSSKILQKEIITLKILTSHPISSS